MHYTKKKLELIYDITSYIGLGAIFAAEAYPHIYLRKTGLEYAHASMLFWGVAIAVIAVFVITHSMIKKATGLQPEAQPEKHGLMRTFIYLSFMDIVEAKSKSIAVNAAGSDTAARNIVLLWVGAFIVVSILIYLREKYYDKVKPARTAE